MARIPFVAFAVCLHLAAAGSTRAEDAIPQEQSDAEVKRRIDELEAQHARDLKALREEIASLRERDGSLAGQSGGERSAPGDAGSLLLNAFNPSLTVFGNFVGRIDDQRVRNEDGDLIDDRFNLREVEIDLRAAIDPFADGVAIITWEAETPGQTETSVEEGYVTLKRIPGFEEPPGGLTLTAGRFRPEFGRNNRIHTHDLPQVTRPRSLQTFLGEEGYIQNGIASEFELPTPGDSNSLRGSVAFVNGGDIAIAADNGGNDPALVSHLKWFFDLMPGHDVEFGASNFLGRASENGSDDARLYGADFTYRWKPYLEGEWRSFLLGGELYVAEIERATGGTDSPFGGFVWSQYQFTRNAYFGARYDYSEMIADEHVDTRTYGAFLTIYTTEFLRFRLGYERADSQDIDLDQLDTGFLEINFVFGSHPVEPYWVNR